MSIRNYTIIRENRSTAVGTVTCVCMSVCIRRLIRGQYIGNNKEERLEKKRGTVRGERKNKFKMYMKENGDTLLDQ
jgi:hypothetical protein